MVFDAKQAGLSISETANLLVSFPHNHLYDLQRTI